VAWKLTDGVIAEIVGDEVVVMTKDGSAIRLSGDVAESMRRMLSGPSSLSELDVARLDSLGVVEPVTPGVSRRGVLVGGAAALGAGIAALSMPAAAAASSLDGIWGDYRALLDFVEVWVYVSPARYDQYRFAGGYPPSAAWPSDLNALDNWSLLFGGKSISLQPENEDNEVSHLFVSEFKFQGDGVTPTANWPQDLYDFLKDDWAAKKTLTLSITNGKVTAPVSLWPIGHGDQGLQSFGAEEADERRFVPRDR